ncbi:hypothetical protein SAMN05444166_0754 [Singulisphaera sp. GP187]|uniref:hypothetical protein n=1 Tax=Singulisphaera sp. GP187 TaxID=1882752 RepID=UPI000928FD42|nr:hypothetical protein [Singulisphaera sp. GP187]SIN77189.1 hypothetical protein SAMN05444166_0754 [Singulisphaera sp. GP187]
MTSLLKRFPIRIWFIQLVILTVAVILGFVLYLDPHPDWPTLGIILLALIPFYLLKLWLLTKAPWSARVFAIGFLIGGVVEFSSLDHSISRDRLRLTPGFWTPEGWYPLAFPAERLLVHSGYLTVSEAFWPSFFIGLTISGLVCGILTLGIYLALRHQRAKKLLVSRQ